MKAYLVLRKAIHSKRWSLDSIFDFTYDKELAEARMNLQKIEARGSGAELQVIECEVLDPASAPQSGEGDPAGEFSPK
jgi:hypothetical protein